MGTKKVKAKGLEKTISDKEITYGKGGLPLNLTKKEKQELKELFRKSTNAIVEAERKRISERVKLRRRNTRAYLREIDKQPSPVYCRVSTSSQENVNQSGSVKKWLKKKSKR